MAKIPSKQLGAALSIKIMACDASLSVGDRVRHDTVNDNKVLEVTTNTDSTCVIGIVKSKPTSTTAEVQFSGLLTGLSLARGRMLLSITGTLTVSTSITTGYVQILGYSFGNGTANFKPNYRRIKLT